MTIDTDGTLSGKTTIVTIGGRKYVSLNPYNVGTKKHEIFKYIEDNSALGVTRKQIEGKYGTYGWAITYSCKSIGLLLIEKVASTDPRVTTKLPVYKAKLEEVKK